MKTNRGWTALLVMVLLTTLCMGQAKKKSYTFKGKVESVDAKAKTLTVNGENVEGWMAAMTMAYEVDDPEVLKKVKAGDQITATVYDGDTILHKVQVVEKPGDKKADKKGKN